MHQKALAELRQAGYCFTAEAGTISYTQETPHGCDPGWALERLQIIKKHKPEVLATLRGEPLYSQAMVAVDIETTGLNSRKDLIRLVSVASDEGSYVVDDPAKVADLLADPGIQKVFHNAAFDVTFFQAKGYVVRNYLDTMIMCQLLSQNRGDHSLAAKVQEYLGLALDKTLQKDTNWHGLLTQAHRNYCRKDAEVTLQLAQKLIPLIKQKNLSTVLNLEIAALPAIVRLQADGIPFAADAWQSDLAGWSATKDALAADIQQELCSKINLASPSQLKTCLQNRGVNIESTSDDELAKFEAVCPVITKIRRWRELHKIVTSFGAKLVAAMEHDGRIYAHWRLIGSTTGRMSCSEPNVQQIPHILRPYFRAIPGHVFVIADFSQIELRVLASLSGDETMRTAFQNDEDLHAKTARMILQKDDISKSERQVAKTANFGLVFGMTTRGLQNRVKTQYELELSDQEAERFRQGFFKLYKGIRRWHEKQILRPQIKTLGGRNWGNLPKSEWRNRFNYPVQGTAAEGLKASLPLLLARLQPHWKLCALVHDEVLLEVPEMESIKAADVVRDCLTRGMATLIPDIPIRVDVSIHTTWKKD